MEAQGREENWLEKALCRGSSVFLPTKGGRGAANQIKECKEVCYHCPVRRECLEDIAGFTWTNLRNGNGVRAGFHGEGLRTAIRLFKKGELML